MKIKLIFIRQGDPVRDLVFRYMGEQEAIKRQILSVDSVTQDIDGLKALIVSIYTVIIHIPVHCLQVYYKIAPEYDEIFFSWFNNCRHWNTSAYCLLPTERRVLSVSNRHVSSFVDLGWSGSREIRGGYSAHIAHIAGNL